MQPQVRSHRMHLRQAFSYMCLDIVVCFMRTLREDLLCTLADLRNGHKLETSIVQYLICCLLQVSGLLTGLGLQLVRTATYLHPFYTLSRTPPTASPSRSDQSNLPITADHTPTPPHWPRLSLVCNIKSPHTDPHIKTAH